MRTLPPLLLTLLLLPLAGCSSGNKTRLEDTRWTSAATTINGQALDAGAVRLEFKPDGKFVWEIRDQPVPYEGKYTLESGDTVIFRFNEDFEGKREHSRKVVIDGDRLTMTDPEGRQMTFYKDKK